MFFVGQLPLAVRMLLYWPYFHIIWSLCSPETNFQHSMTHTLRAQTRQSHDFCQIRVFLRAATPSFPTVVTLTLFSYYLEFVLARDKFSSPHISYFASTNSTKSWFLSKCLFLGGRYPLDFSKLFFDLIFNLIGVCARNSHIFNTLALILYEHKLKIVLFRASLF